jgi:hypothetical protein
MERDDSRSLDDTNIPFEKSQEAPIKLNPEIYAPFSGREEGFAPRIETSKSNDSIDSLDAAE